MRKRTHVYVMPPAAYEISGCKCGNTNPEWSEYEGHLWCAKCQIDFIPEYGGIFEGPIPVNISRLMGIDLRMINLETEKIEDSCGQFTESNPHPVSPKPSQPAPLK